MTDFLATLSPSLSLLRAHLYVGGAHITVRSPRGLADGIAHKSRGQKGKIPFPFGAKNALTPLCNLRKGYPQKNVAILI